MGLFVSAKRMLASYLAKRRNSEPSLSDDTRAVSSLYPPPLVISSPVLNASSAIPHFTVPPLRSPSLTQLQRSSNFLNTEDSSEPPRRRKSCPEVYSPPQEFPELPLPPVVVLPQVTRERVPRRSGSFTGEPPQMRPRLYSSSSTLKSSLVSAQQAVLRRTNEELMRLPLLTRSDSSIGDATSEEDIPNTLDDRVVEGVFGLRLSGRKILAAVNFSTASAYAFRWLARSQLRNGDKLHVVHVVDDTASTRWSLRKVVLKQHHERREELKAELTRRLSQFVKENLACVATSDINLHIVLHVVFGNVKQTLIKKIDSIFPDLVVAGLSQQFNTLSGLWSPENLVSHLMGHSIAPVAVAKDPTLMARFTSFPSRARANSTLSEFLEFRPTSSQGSMKRENSI